jgi:hypothetical protein
MTARKKKPPKTPAANSPLAAAEIETDFSEETESDIESFFNSHSQESVVAVYRAGKPGERDGYLDTLGITTLLNPGPEHVLATTFGAGTYRLKLKVPNQRGILQFGGSKTVTIAERPGAHGITNGNGHGAGTMEDYLRKESERNQNLILALIASNKPQAFDMTGFAQLIAAVSGGNKNSDLGAIVSAFTSLKAAAEPPNTVNQIKDAIELARSLTPGGPAAAPGEEPEMGWGGLIKGALTAFAGGVPAGPVNGRRALAAGQPGPGAGDDDDDEPNEDQYMQQALTAQLGFMKSKALAGKAVEPWIAYTLENQDEIGNAAIMSALKQGAQFEHLLAFDPEIASNPILRVWFQKFYDGLKRPVSQAPPVPWFGRDITNLTGNAGAGPDGQPDAGSTPGSGNSGGPANT